MMGGGAFDNGAVAARLERLADLLELTEANPFRVRAYRTAAETVAAHDRPVVALSLEELLSLKGVGKDLARAIRDLAEEGEIPQLRELEREVPPGLLDVTKVPGVGPKRAATLWRRLDVRSLDDLEREARSGRVADLPGFGEKTQAKLLAGISGVRARGTRLRLIDAEALAAPLVAALGAVPGVSRVDVAGSLRRGRDTVGDLDLLAQAADGEAAMAALRGDGRVIEVIGSGPTKTSVRLRGGVQVDLRVVEPDAYGAALLYFTGSKAHNVALRSRAAERGLRLSEYGLFELDARGEIATRVAGAHEEDVYGALGLTPVPPELREDRGEVEASAAGRLPRLLVANDVRGDLHVHTDWSDGTASIEEMVAACRRRGYEYMAITDHSQALRMTGGLDAEKLARQGEALDALGDTGGLTVLRGLEVDIRRDGSLDLDDEWLARLDIVIASVHSHFDLDVVAQTERVLAALAHPEVNVLAHPTGRVLGRRDGLALDLEAVFAAAAAQHVAVELNAAPQRLDLGDVALMQAARAGCLVAVDTDAHSVAGLDDMRYGVLTARRAWLGPQGVINAWPLHRLRSFLAKAT
jgi:DNA polymerase (family X)